MMKPDQAWRIAVAKKKYTINEVFRSFQGEGHYAGSPAVFVRFAGCNMWNGRDQDREGYSLSHGARCPLVCDTDFSAKRKVTGLELVTEVLCKYQDEDLLVLTGGEPLLQVDVELVKLFREFGVKKVSVETNGTIDTKPFAGVMWTAVAPKVLAGEARRPVTHADEVKVLNTFSSYEELDAACDTWELSKLDKLVNRWVMPVDYPKGALPVFRLPDAGVVDHLREKLGGDWRLGIQAHKVWGVK